MKKISALLVFLGVISSQFAFASEHHSGHTGMSSGNGGGGHCTKAHISKFSPAHLALTPPKSLFSFVAFNVYKPETISVSIKNKPVEVHVLFKDPFYVVTGQLPDDLSNTTARINVKISGKIGSCDTEGGWLVKIE